MLLDHRIFLFLCFQILNYDIVLSPLYSIRRPLCLVIALINTMSQSIETMGTSQISAKMVCSWSCGLWYVLLLLWIICIGPVETHDSLEAWKHLLFNSEEDIVRKRIRRWIVGKSQLTETFRKDGAMSEGIVKTS